MSVAAALTRRPLGSGADLERGAGPADFDVSIVIPTFRRPRSLARAIESCQRQLDAPASEIIVVDNCPQRSAGETVAEAGLTSDVPIRYEHEPVAGVAAARNRGVAVARAPLVAFLDDDEEADERWLSKLVAARAAHDADAVFGAVWPEVDGCPPPAADAYLQILARRFPEPPGEVPRRRRAALGTGNSLFHVRSLGKRPFDPALGLGGGEDSALIKRLVHEGRRFIWNPEARVKEFLPAERANLRYLLRRRFSDGQVRTSTCLVQRPRQPGRALFWMAAGAVQVLLCAILALLAAPLRPGASQRYLCSAASGLGKVLWMRPFRVLRYPTQQARAKLE